MITMHSIKTALTTSICFFIALAMIFWIARKTDHDMRADILAGAVKVAAALDREQIRALRGSSADLGTEPYLALKNQFEAIRAADSNCRFVYLMGRKPDGRVFFYVDNEPVGSEDESPAGEIYDDIPGDFLRVFDQNEAQMTGPDTDKWGTWITALVPIQHPDRDGRIAVFAIDFDARDWKSMVAFRAAVPASLILLPIVALVFMVLREAKSRLKLAQAELDTSNQRFSSSAALLDEGPSSSFLRIMETG